MAVRIRKKPLSAWQERPRRTPRGHRAPAFPEVLSEVSGGHPDPGGRVLPLLHVEDLSVSYGTMRALDGVDLDVYRGEVVALAGENGAGKSTLVRCIAGDMAPGGGRILISGRKLPANPSAVSRCGVAVVWQDLALCANLDVAANLLLGAEPHRLLLSETRFHDTAATLLSELHIPLTDTTRLISSLSGGQRQLVAVARAMRDRPQLLILDEPTASLGVLESAQVEGLTLNLRRQGTTILLVSHDVEQMFRLADRIVILRHGRVAADVDPAQSHPDEVAALLSGQEIDSTPRRQLRRLHGLADRLASADPSSSLSLILSALGAALGTERLCMHLVENPATTGGRGLRAAASLNLPQDLATAWSELPWGDAGGPVGRAAASIQPVLDGDVRSSPAWEPFALIARRARIGSSWSLPVTGSIGVMGVITVFRTAIGMPRRDELDLLTLYAGYAANAVERDRLVGELTARNRVLETIREVLETLAGPVPLVRGLTVALHSLRVGLQANEVGLLSGQPSQVPECRAFVSASGHTAQASPAVLAAASAALSQHPPDGQAHRLPSVDGGWDLTVTFAAPSGPTALVAHWTQWDAPPDGSALMDDAAHSLRLALEREESERAHQEAAALRRSQELQRQFLSRLSHELRTPLTAIRGYASSLMQSDVSWDGDSQARFLTRIGAESARLGRLVDDLLDFSAIESDILRLQPDWCDISLVLDAALSCLPPAGAAMVKVTCPADTPVVWADHDRLEQLFVNLLDNALRHNPPGTRVEVAVAAEAPTRPETPGRVAISVTDDGQGVPPEMVTTPFEAHQFRRGPTSGAGLGLTIAQGIVDAHGGSLEVERLGSEGGRPASGTRFVIHLPVELNALEALHDD